MVHRFDGDGPRHRAKNAPCGERSDTDDAERIATTNRLDTRVTGGRDVMPGTRGAAAARGADSRRRAWKASLAAAWTDCQGSGPTS